MFGSAILEIGISMVFVYLLLSLICSAVQEGLEGWLKVRASNLEHGIKALLQHPELVEKVYQHPLIYGLYRGPYQTGRNNMTSVLPTYIPSAHFATALLDVVVQDAAKAGAVTSAATAAGADPDLLPLTTAHVRQALEGNQAIPYAVKRVLVLALDEAGDDLAKTRANLEEWFNSGMERVSGWYKRYTHQILLAMGLVVSVSMNVNSLTIATELYHNQSLREAVTAQADAASKAAQPDAAAANDYVKKLADLKFPIGWDATGEPTTPLALFFWRLIGWLTTAFAISFGAPFWFDMLGKLTSLRSTVKPMQKAIATVTEGNDGGK